MPGNYDGGQFRITLAPRVDEIFDRIAKRDPALHERIEGELVKLARAPQLGKPLRHGLKNRRRLHVGSFVIVYEIMGDEAWVFDFGHHNDIYKKYL